MRIFLASIVLLMGSVMAQADADVTAVSDQASQLIQGYMIQHPDMVSNMTPTDDQIANEMQSIRNLSSADIAANINVAAQSEANLPSLYPIDSAALTPGPVFSRAIQINLTTPMAIVGDDPLSKTWLTQHKKELIAEHAEVMVVNIVSETEMESLQANFPDLSLIPMNGDSLATSIQLRHYPVLITNRLIQ